MEKTKIGMAPADVHGTINRFMVADGLGLVMDLDRSRQSRIYDTRGGEYFLDFFGCFATVPLGYNHPRFQSQSVREQLARVATHKPSNSDVYTLELAEFVTAFSETAMPDFMRHLFFIEGGALAVENALKAAFDWKMHKNGRPLNETPDFKVLHFEQAFHGRSGYTLSLTNTADPRKVRYFPKFNWPRVKNPACRFPLEGANLEAVQSAEQESIAQIEEAIHRNPAEIACLIIEPIQGEGGDNHFRPEFHRELRRICDENELLLIYDEVQTGFGGTGKMWAFEHFAQPDLLAFGKKSQVCGFMASQRLDEVPENVFQVSSRINSTWGGNLIDMVRCRIYLEVYQEENILAEAARLGKILLKELRDLESEFSPLVSNSRGLGLLCAFDLPDRETRDRLRQLLFQKRLLILGCGERSIRFRTALNIPEEDLRRGVHLIREALAELV